MSKCVLVVAATDSSGGAGLLRDVQVLTRLGVTARCAVTAITAQSDTFVHSSYGVPAAMIRSQMECALAAGDVAAIKIGMLGTRAAIEAVIEALPPREQIPIVLDPVLRASSGGRLLDTEGQALLTESLIPRVTLLTPNTPEAGALLAECIAMDETQRLSQAKRLLALGPSAVLLKGGHGEESTVVDLLLSSDGRLVHIATPRLAGTVRGTGCMLASAIAAGLVGGRSLETACRDAQALVVSVLSAPG